MENSKANGMNVVQSDDLQGLHGMNVQDKLVN